MQRWLKLVLIVLLTLAVLAGAAAAYQTFIANPRVASILRSAPDGDLARRVLLITLPDGRTLPVNYLREGDRIYLGVDGPWWRQFRGAGAGVRLFVRGRSLGGWARAIENDPEHRAAVFARLRPDVPRWLPDRLNAVLVEVALDPAQT